MSVTHTPVDVAVFDFKLIFAVISEMRDPREYNKSMFTAQAFITVFNLVVGIVIYTYCGQYVASPALGSAGPLIKKVWIFPRLVCCVV
jgi:hypothetical protein